MPKKKPTIEELEERQLVLSEERTILSKERTILSFMQTGLAFIGVGIVVTYYFKESIVNTVGYILIAIGFVEVMESIRRLRKKQMEIHNLKREGAI